MPLVSVVTAKAPLRSTRPRVSVTSDRVLVGRLLYLLYHSNASASSLIAFIPLAERWHQLPSMPQHLDQRLTVARPSSHDRCPPPRRPISRSHRQGEATSRRGVQTGQLVPGTSPVVLSFNSGSWLTKSGQRADTNSARGVPRPDDPSKWRVCASLSPLRTRKPLWLAMPKPSARPNVGSRTRLANG